MSKKTNGNFARRERWRIIAPAILLLGAGVVFAVGVETGNGGRLSFVSRRAEWAIAIYSGSSPYDLRPAEGIRCPALTADDVTDADAQFVADPFMVRSEGTWYMFFEVLNRATGQGDIALATSENGLDWRYRRVVLDEPFHLSYPYVFEWDGEHYMIPESFEANAVRLYRAAEFPDRWEYVRDLVRGVFVDPSICRFNDRWWLFASSIKNNELRLFFADDLAGAWREHPESPVVVGDANVARPGGRVFLLEGRAVRLTQDDDPSYGNGVRAFEIRRLTTFDYEEKEIATGPILTAAGQGWNAAGMHNADPHRIGDGRWIACVDGHHWNTRFEIRY